MPYQVSRFGPQTWALALNHEHWYERTWANRSASGVSTENVVNKALQRSSQNLSHFQPVHFRNQCCNWPIGVILTLSRRGFCDDNNVDDIWKSYVLNVNAKTFQWRLFRSISRVKRYVVYVKDVSTWRELASRLVLRHQVEITCFLYAKAMNEPAELDEYCWENACHGGFHKRKSLPNCQTLRLYPPERPPKEISSTSRLIGLVHTFHVWIC